MKKQIFALLLATLLLLTACASPAQTATAAPTQAPAEKPVETAAPAPTAAPTEAPAPEEYQLSGAVLSIYKAIILDRPSSS